MTKIQNNKTNISPLTLSLSPKGEGDRLLPLPSGERIEVRGMSFCFEHLIFEFVWNFDIRISYLKKVDLISTL